MGCHYFCNGHFLLFALLATVTVDFFDNYSGEMLLLCYFLIFAFDLHSVKFFCLKQTKISSFRRGANTFARHCINRKYLA